MNIDACMASTSTVDGEIDKMDLGLTTKVLLTNANCEKLTSVPVDVRLPYMLWMFVGRDRVRIRLSPKTWWAGWLPKFRALEIWFVQQKTPIHSCHRV